jgi:hypothetical protein
MDLFAALLTGLLAGGGIRAFLVASRGIRRVLPDNGDTVIDPGVLQPGRLDGSCGTGMYTGRLTVTQAPV